MEGQSTNDLYRQCQRNHAASLGSYATDGCGEFTLDVDTTSPGSLQCAACGCHRNFHRKVWGGGEYYGGGLSESGQRNKDKEKKRRLRTKFTAEQKEKMLAFAEKLQWKLQRKEEAADEIQRFCRGVGVSRQVFKVWMHNHKKSSSSSSSSSSSIANVVHSSLTQ